MRGSASAGLCLLLLLFTLPGCSPGSTVDADLESSSEVWRLSTDPILTIGDGSTEATAFERISGVFEHDTTRIIAVDRGSAEIRLFDLGGAHLGTWGGRGDGPGEYRRPRLLGRIHPDTMVILDEQDQQISSLSVDGDPGWSLSLLESTHPMRSQALGVLGSGQVVFQEVRFFDPSPGRVELLSDTLILHLLDPSTGSITEVGPSVAPVWVWTGEEQVPMPFSPRLTETSAGDRLYTLNPDGSEILVYGPEGLRDSWSAERVPEPVSRSHRDAYREAVKNRSFSAELEEAWLSALDHAGLPEALPLFDEVLAADDGEVWARRYSLGGQSKKWDVFSGDGRLRGFVETPGDLLLRQITESHVLGVKRDSLGVESIAVYEKHAVEDSTQIAGAWDQVRAELFSLVELEQIHFADYGSYTSNLDSLIFAPTEDHPDVAITILFSGRKGFSATASHPALRPGEGCAVFWGRPTVYPEAPAAPEVAGDILCSDRETGAGVAQGSR